MNDGWWFLEYEPTLERNIASRKSDEEFSLSWCCQEQIRRHVGSIHNDAVLRKTMALKKTSSNGGCVSVVDYETMALSYSRGLTTKEWCFFINEHRGRMSVVNWDDLRSRNHWVREESLHVEVSQHWGTPKWMVYNLWWKIQVKSMIWGYPYFKKPPLR